MRGGERMIKEENDGEKKERVEQRGREEGVAFESYFLHFCLLVDL